MKQLFRVVKCGEAFTVKSEKSESGTLNKRNVVLQEIGSKYENQYAVALLGNDAGCQFYPDDLVYAALRFQVREYNGQAFQDITAAEIIKFN